MKIKKLSFDKQEKATILAASASFFLFVLMVKISSISLDRLVILQTEFLNIFFGGNAEFLHLSLILQLFFALIFLSLSLSILCMYGVIYGRYEVGLMSAIISSIVMLIIIPSLLSLFMAAAIIISFSYTVIISNAYFGELKKWRLFRTGSNSIGKALTIINVIIALGILVTISLNSEHYKEIFKNDITDTIGSAALSTVKIESPLIKEQIKKNVANVVDTSPVFQSYIKWLPFLTALSLLIVLQAIKSVVLTNIAGIITSILLRRYKTK